MFSCAKQAIVVLLRFGSQRLAAAYQAEEAKLHCSDRFMQV